AHRDERLALLRVVAERAYDAVDADARFAGLRERHRGAAHALRARSRRGAGDHAVRRRALVVECTRVAHLAPAAEDVLARLGLLARALGRRVAARVRDRVEARRRVLAAVAHLAGRDRRLRARVCGRDEERLAGLVIGEQPALDQVLAAGVDGLGL